MGYTIYKLGYVLTATVPGFYRKHAPSIDPLKERFGITIFTLPWRERVRERGK